MAIGLDYIHRIDPAVLKAAGVSTVFRYLSYPSALGKVIGNAEYDELRAAGLTVILNWEWDAQDWLGGTSAGTSHGREAVRQAKSLGYPSGMPIVGSCDFNITSAQWSAVGRSYAIAFANEIANGGYRPGVYGPWDVLDWCRPIMTYFWQAGMSTSWSGGRNKNDFPYANWIQRGYKTVAGQSCDWNTIVGGLTSMDWNDKLGAGHNPNNTFRNVEADLGDLRNLLFSTADQAAAQGLTPPDGSNLALLLSIPAKLDALMAAITELGNMEHQPSIGGLTAHDVETALSDVLKKGTDNV